MATVINNPATGTGTQESSGLGTVLAIVIALIVIAALLFAGIPLIRGRSNGGNTGASLNVPSTVDVNVPDKVDMNVNRTP